MKPLLPEVAGSHLAGKLERSRAQAIYEKQARDTKKGCCESMLEKNTCDEVMGSAIVDWEYWDSRVTVRPRTTTPGGISLLHESIRSALKLERTKQDFIPRAFAIFSDFHGQGDSLRRAWGKGGENFKRRVANACSDEYCLAHGFSSFLVRVFELLIGKHGRVKVVGVDTENIGVETRMAEIHGQSPVPAPTSLQLFERPTGSVSDGIVQVVDGFDFRLPTLDRAGAEAARVTLTHLAEKLGYSDKAQLKLLANRHAQQLAEFGQTFAVKVWITGGVARRQVDELTFNADQAAYLALSSETEQGRACRVRILKAYKVLLSMFEEKIVRATTVDPVLELLRQQAEERKSEAEERRQSNQLVAQSLNAMSQALAKIAPVAAPPANTFDPYARLRALPQPKDVKDVKCLETFEFYCKVFDEEIANKQYGKGRSIVHDAIEQSFDPSIRSKDHGTKIKYMHSKPQDYKRKVLNIAFKLLIWPYVRQEESSAAE